MSTPMYLVEAAPTLERKVEGIVPVKPSMGSPSSCCRPDNTRVVKLAGSAAGS